MVTFWVCNMYVKLNFRGAPSREPTYLTLRKRRIIIKTALGRDLFRVNFGEKLPSAQCTGFLSTTSITRGGPTPTGLPRHCHKHAVEWLKSPPRSSPEVWLFSTVSTAVSLDARRDKGTSECAWTTAPRTARQSSGTSWFRNSAKEVFNASWMEGLSWGWWFQAPVGSHYIPKWKKKIGAQNWIMKNVKSRAVFETHTKKKEKHNSGWPAVFSDFKPWAQLTGAQQHNIHGRLTIHEGHQPGRASREPTVDSQDVNFPKKKIRQLQPWQIWGCFAFYVCIYLKKLYQTHLAWYFFYTKKQETHGDF